MKKWLDDNNFEDGNMVWNLQEEVKVVGSLNDSNIKLALSQDDIEYETPQGSKKKVSGKWEVTMNKSTHKITKGFLDIKEVNGTLHDGFTINVASDGIKTTSNLLGIYANNEAKAKEAYNDMYSAIGKFLEEKHAEISELLS